MFYLKCTILIHRFFQHKTDQRITKLQDAARFVIEIHLPLGSWLGLVEFDTHAFLISKDGIIQIDSDARRQEMVSLIPPVRGGSTCIGCGLNMALSVSYTEIILFIYCDFKLCFNRDIRWTF